MADEEPKDSDREEVVKEGKPWLALSLMLLVVPVVTLAIVQFVAIPMLQSSMGITSPVKKEAKEDKGGHGGAAKNAELGGSGSSYAYDEIVANLSGTMGTRFIKVSFEVRGESADLTQILRVNKPIVLDAIIYALSSESIQSLEVPGGRNRLRLTLIQSINEALGGNFIEELYFTEFIIQ
jgi:flagellar FliL protein